MFITGNARVKIYPIDSELENSGLRKGLGTDQYGRIFFLPLHKALGRSLKSQS